jgi:hypothetical protein
MSEVSELDCEAIRREIDELEELAAFAAQLGRDEVAQRARQQAKQLRRTLK